MYSVHQKITIVSRLCLYRAVMACLLLVLILLHVRASIGSLSIDETVTSWASASPVSLERAFRYPWQSGLYFLTNSFVLKLFGSSEFSHRLLSLLCTALCGWLLMLLARRLAPGCKAELVPFFFWALPPVQQFAVSARPYAAAFAACAAAVWAAAQWRETGLKRFAALFVLAQALMAGFSVFFVLLSVIAAVWAFLGRNQEKISRFRAARLAVGAFVFLLPLAPGMMTIFGSREFLNWTTTTSGGPSLAWTALLLLLCAALLVIAVLSAGKRAVAAVTLRSLLLPSLWAVLPPAAAYLGSRWLSVDIYHLRYFAAALPGAALFAGIIAAQAMAAAAPGARQGGMLIAALLACITAESISRDDSRCVENWASAVREVRSVSPSSSVYAYTGLVELHNHGFVHNPLNHPYLLAPFAKYVLEPRPGILAPGVEPGDGINGFIGMKNGAHDGGAAAIVRVVQFPGETSVDWTARQFMGAGLALERSRCFGLVCVLSFRSRQLREEEKQAALNALPSYGECVRKENRM